MKKALLGLSILGVLIGLYSLQSSRNSGSHSVAISGITVLEDKQLIEWTEYILSAPSGDQQGIRAQELYRQYHGKCFLALLEAVRLREACLVMFPELQIDGPPSPVNRTAKEQQLCEDYGALFSAVTVISYDTPKIDIKTLLPFLVAFKETQNIAIGVCNTNPSQEGWENIAIVALRRQNDYNLDLINALQKRLDASKTSATPLPAAVKEDVKARAKIGED